MNCQGKAHINPGIEDVTSLCLNFDDGGFATIHSSWLDPNKVREMVFVGSKKMLVFDDMQNTEKLRVFDKGATVGIEQAAGRTPVNVRHGDILVPHLQMREPLAIETQHFIDCIVNDTTPRSDGVDGLRSRFR